MARLVKAKCPNCGAGVRVDPDATSVTCEYCNTTSFVQDAKAPKPAQAQGPTIVVQRHSTSMAVLIWVGVLVAGLIGGLVIIVMAFVAERMSPSSVVITTETVAEKQLDPAARLRQLHDPNKPPPRSDFKPDEVCLCRSDTDGKAGLETMQLATNVHAFDGTRVVTRYYMDISGQEPWYLPLGDRTAPSITTDKHFVQLYIACNEHIVAIAANDLITGWDVEARKPAWTTPLGGQYKGEQETPPRKPNTFSYQCTRLNVNEEVLEIPTSNGPVHVRLADGAVVQ